MRTSRSGFPSSAARPEVTADLSTPSEIGGFHWWTSDQPLVKTAFLQDSLGTASAVVGLVSLLGYTLLGSVPAFDAVGALAIAMLMVLFAVTLIVQMHHLIAGALSRGRWLLRFGPG